MDQAYQRVLGELRPGEKLLWWGRPDASKLFNTSDLFLVPFSFLWLGLLLYMMFGTNSGFMPGPTPIVFGLFAIVGVYMTVGRFFVKLALARRTLYALTDSRALIIGRHRSLRDHSARGGAISTEVTSSGRHVTVRFGDTTARSNVGFAVRSNSLPENSGLDMLPFSRPTSFVFYDVTDVVGINSAVAIIRAGLAAR